MPKLRSGTGTQIWLRVLGVRPLTSFPEDPGPNTLSYRSLSRAIKEVSFMSVINTNMSALVATNAIIANDRNQEIAMERLSTGLRINSASDDAAGLAISSRMQAEVSGLNMATRNANDAISMIETIDGSSREIGAALQRMRELSVQAASDTYGVADRAALDLEFGELMAEMTRIATQTTWNEITVMNGANGNLAAGLTSAVTSESLVIQLGKASGQNMTLTMKSFDPRTAIKASARLQRVNPVTGAEIAAVDPVAAVGPAAPAIIRTRFNNLFDNNWPAEQILSVATLDGGDDRERTADTAAGADGATMTVAQQAAAIALGMDYSGNDNHVMANPTIANRRDGETQAFGRAVLYVGNNLDTGDESGGVNGAPNDPDGPWRVPMQSPAGERINLLSRVNATYALLNLDIAISAVSAERAKYGAYIARFEHAVDNLTNVSRHQEQSRSKIADADYAIETSELSRTTIITQASPAMLAQANAAKQSVLTLLQ